MYRLTIEWKETYRPSFYLIALIPLSIFADIDLSFSSTKSRSSDPEWILLRRIASVLQRSFPFHFLFQLVVPFTLP